MNLLRTVTLNNIDIAAPVDIVDYITLTTVQIQPMVLLTGLYGFGGNYSLQVRINGNLLVPDKPISVSSGTTNAQFTGRPIILNENDNIIISLLGNANDNNVNVATRIFDTTPATTYDFVQGATPLLIDAINTDIANLNITVKPETKVIGSCVQNQMPSPQQLPRTVRRPIHGFPR